LGVAQGTSGRLVKMILVKASFLFCERNAVEWAVLAARPPLNKGYEKLMFSDILSGETFIPLPRANNVPHHVMAFEIATGKERWTDANHPMLNFFSYTNHPDINVDTPPSNRVTRNTPRRTTTSDAAYSSGGA
jgi:hypothetical protein